MVLVRIRDRDRGGVHNVSIEAEKVAEHTIDENANPPFSDEEQDEAYRLISADAKLGKLVEGRGVGIEWFSAGEHGGGRVIGARLVGVQNHRVVKIIAEAEVELDEGVLCQERRHR